MTNFTSRTTRKAQGGFTLLEMLVTVGIMAAVAGTATLALQDTTARASAAAHVAMMDELNEGARVFKAMPSNAAFPNNFDSLVQTADAAMGTPALYSRTAIDDVAAYTLTADDVTNLGDVGIDSLQYINLGDATFTLVADGGTCADPQGLINSRRNAIVSGNIFLTAAGNGCGYARTLAAGDTVMAWTGGQERLTGQPGLTLTAGANPGDAHAAAADGEAVYMAVGFGPASTLFDTTKVGGLTSVPVYRHVGADEYNRFIGIFYLGDYVDVAGTVTYVPGEQVQMISVVDGAGDTKEEELGEWDGSRNTI